MILVGRVQSTLNVIGLKKSLVQNELLVVLTVDFSGSQLDHICQKIFNNGKWDLHLTVWFYCHDKCHKCVICRNKNTCHVTNLLSGSD